MDYAPSHLALFALITIRYHYLHPAPFWPFWFFQHGTAKCFSRSKRATEQIGKFCSPIRCSISVLFLMINNKYSLERIIFPLTTGLASIFLLWFKLKFINLIFLACVSSKLTFTAGNNRQMVSVAISCLESAICSSSDIVAWPRSRIITEWAQRIPDRSKSSKLVHVPHR